jgi:transposase
MFTGMIFNLTSREREELRTLQRKNRDKKIYIRVTVLLMLDSGFSREQIASALGIDLSTISRYKDKFRQSKDLEAYLSDNYLAYSGKLTKQEEAILAKELEDNFYRTTYEIAEFIEERFKKSYGSSPLIVGFVFLADDRHRPNTKHPRAAKSTDEFRARRV